MLVRLMCINDSNKPKEIPKEKWIVKEQVYKAVRITVHPNQNNIQGVELEEICLDETCHPYVTFKLDRFALNQEDLEAFIELIKYSNELNDIDFDSLLKDVKTEVFDESFS